MALLLGLGMVIMFLAGCLFMRELMLFKYPHIKNAPEEKRAYASETHPGRWWT